MQSLLDLQPGENVRAILPVRDLEEEGKFIFFATRNGTVKKTPLKDFSNVMARGIIAIGIDKEDELVTASITDGNADRLPRNPPGHGHPFRRERRSLHGPSGLRRPRHRPCQERLCRRRRRYPQGARARRVRILAITENGFGKRTDVEEYRLQTRGGKGVKNMAVTARIGRVSGIQLVDDTSELMVISQFGKIIRIDTKTIRAAGRATQGRSPAQPRTRRQSRGRRDYPAGRAKRRRPGDAVAVGKSFQAWSLGPGNSVALVAFEQSIQLSDTSAPRQALGFSRRGPTLKLLWILRTPPHAPNRSHGSRAGQSLVDGCRGFSASARADRRPRSICQTPLHFHRRSR